MDTKENILDIIDEEVTDEFESEVDEVEESEEEEEGSQIKGQELDKGQASEKGKKKQRRAGKKKTNKAKAAKGKRKLNVDRYALNVCKELGEKKLFMVYNAIDCIGKSAFEELVNQVKVIQAEGGKRTSSGERFRSGGGVFWSLLKTTSPVAYKCITKRQKHLLGQCAEAQMTPKG